MLLTVFIYLSVNYIKFDKNFSSKCNSQFLFVNAAVTLVFNEVESQQTHTHTHNHRPASLI